MTAAPPTDASDAPAGGPFEIPPAEDAGITMPDAGTGERARRRRTRERRRRVHQIAYALSVAVLALSIPVLGTIGFSAVINSRAGKQVDATKGPNDPGFEATVEHTRVGVVAEVDASNHLVSVAVLALGTGDQGGAVVLVPVGTLATVQSGGTERLSDIWDAGGIDPLKSALALVVGTSFDEGLPIDAGHIAELVQPVSPLAIVNPDEVQTTGPDGKPVRFAAGPLTLTADQVPLYLGAKGTDESELARLARQQVLWTAWLAAIKASSDPNVVPGETSVGIGLFVRGLAAGDPRFDPLPVEPATGGAADDEAYQPDAAAVRALMGDVVPSPTSPAPGVRARVRLLDGRRLSGGAQAAARALVLAGAEVDVLGNPDPLRAPHTTIEYYDRSAKAAADSLRAALGVGEVKLVQGDNDSIDITVTLGADYDPAGITTTTGTVNGSNG
jgi:hypothetical protein